MDLENAARTAEAVVKPKATRVSNMMQDIADVLSRGHLTPSHAARLVGKADFIASCLFGKVGRACLAGLRVRQYQCAPPFNLPPWLRASLVWLRDLLGVCPPRTVPLGVSAHPPVLIYTDGAARMGDMWLSPGAVSDEDLSSLGVGAVMWDPLGRSLEFCRSAIPRAEVSRWLPRKQPIMLVELFAAPMALETWAETVRGRNVLLYVDNNSALSALVKGYTPKVDSAKIVSQFWLTAARVRCGIWAERVESKSNIADGPSRGDVTLMRQMVAKETRARLSFLVFRPGGGEEPES